MKFLAQILPPCFDRAFLSLLDSIKPSVLVRGFLGSVKRSNVQQSSPGQTEGLKVGCGMGGWVVGGMDGWAGGV
jgi:hypothetical protein